MPFAVLTSCARATKAPPRVARLAPEMATPTVWHALELFGWMVRAVRHILLIATRKARWLQHQLPTQRMLYAGRTSFAHAKGARPRVRLLAPTTGMPNVLHAQEV